MVRTGFLNSCWLYEEEFWRAFVKGLIHDDADLFTDGQFLVLGTFISEKSFKTWMLRHILTSY